MNAQKRSPLLTRQDGAALLGASIALVVLLSLAGVMAVNTSSDTQQRGAFAHSITGFYAAESGLNIGMARFRNIFLDYNVPTASDFAARSVQVGDRQVTYGLQERSSNPKTVVMPAGEIFAGVNSIQYSYVVSSTSTNTTGDHEAKMGAEFLVSYIPLFQFAAFYKNDLEILPGPDMVLTGRVHTNGDLYLNAGSTLKIGDDPAMGIHTVQVSAGGDIYRGRKDSNRCDGDVIIDMLHDSAAPSGDLDPRDLPCDGSDTRVVPRSELDYWQGSIKSGIDTINIPEPDILDKGTGVFWEKADLRIVLVLDQPGQLPGGPVLPHTIEVQNADGSTDAAKTAALHAFMSDSVWNLANSVPYAGTMPVFYSDLPFDADPACGGCNDGNPGCGGNADNVCYTTDLPNRTAANAYSPIMGPALGLFDLDYRRGGFYNHREHKWILMLNVNVGDLIRWNQQNGQPLFAHADSSQGGIVLYATIEGPDSDAINRYGVRVFGGANLPLSGGIGVTTNPTGLTVVSDQALYALGDYNRGAVAAASLQAWSDPTILPRQPAALIGDSINILSEGYWSPACVGALCRDGQSVDALANGPRNAVATVINAAFLGGVDTTPAGFAANYNGGIENYPRFHETWSGVWFRYRGSFVSLGEPEHVDGAWCGTGGGCNIYDPPNRDWDFDTAFNDTANLPPLTPRFTFLEQRVFAQELR